LRWGLTLLPRLVSNSWGSSNPLVSAPQVAGTTHVCHCAWLWYFNGRLWMFSGRGNTGMMAMTDWGFWQRWWGWPASFLRLWGLTSSLVALAIPMCY
jgi:hypothetical protein